MKYAKENGEKAGNRPVSTDKWPRKPVSTPAPRSALRVKRSTRPTDTSKNTKECAGRIACGIPSAEGRWSTSVVIPTTGMSRKRLMLIRRTINEGRAARATANAASSASWPGMRAIARNVPDLLDAGATAREIAVKARTKDT